MQTDMKLPHHVHAFHTEIEEANVPLNFILRSGGWLPDSDSASGCYRRRMFSLLGKATATRRRRHHLGKNAAASNVSLV